MPLEEKWYRVADDGSIQEAMSHEERHAFANEAAKALDHDLVKNVMEEFAGNMRFELTGLPAYGLAKVAIYAAQVARAQALGINPDLLRNK